jgi:hypothetical protein
MRDELSVAFSENDGATWTPPVVIASQKDAWLSYPRILEVKPGLVWITTMQGKVRLQFREKDLLHRG